jgi:glutamate-ammonia-ligase adenylyltransferase
VLNTLQALGCLFSHRLSASEYRVLSGYIFLRTVEHHLQMMHYQQTLAPGRAKRRPAQLARRWVSWDRGGRHFVLRYQQHCTAVRAIYLEHIGNGDIAILRIDRDPTDRQAEHSILLPSQIDIPNHLLSMHPSRR